MRSVGFKFLVPCEYREGLRQGCASLEADTCCRVRRRGSTQDLSENTPGLKPAEARGTDWAPTAPQARGMNPGLDAVTSLAGRCSSLRLELVINVSCISSLFAAASSASFVSR